MLRGLRERHPLFFHFALGFMPGLEDEDWDVAVFSRVMLDSIRKFGEYIFSGWGSTESISLLR